MHTTRAAQRRLHTQARRRTRRSVAGVAALTTALTGALLASPALAAEGDDHVAAGELEWGFRSSFRGYVGNQTGALPTNGGAVPVGERITLVAPGQFDLAGTPALPGSTSNPNETLPYLLPASGGQVVSETELTIDTAGGAVYHFPSHFFDITVENVSIVVDTDGASVVADLGVEVHPGYDIPAGSYGGEDVVVGDVAEHSVSISGSTATVTGTGVTLTEAGSTALQGFLNPGDALDDFTVTVDLGEAPAAAPAVSVSQDRLPAGEVTEITVTGTGFDPALATGTRPPLSGQPAGAYVAFGKYLDAWKPSEGAPSSARKNASVAQGGQKWAVPAGSMETIGGASAGAIELRPDGSFTTTMLVNTAWLEANPGNYGIYTYPGSGGSSAAYETFTPLSFYGADVPAAVNTVVAGQSLPVEVTGFDANSAAEVWMHSDPVKLADVAVGADGTASTSVEIPADAEAGDHELVVRGLVGGASVEVVAARFTVLGGSGAFQVLSAEVAAEAGALTISVDAQAVDLGVLELSSDGTVLEGAGDINPVRVTDTRAEDTGWTVSGSLTDLTSADGVIGSSYLGWAPSLIGADGPAVTVGTAVTAGEPGLSGAAVLGSAANGSRGTAALGAGVTLRAPASTPPGSYVGTLTLTVV